jgi:hypothetical protein
VCVCVFVMVMHVSMKQMRGRIGMSMQADSAAPGASPEHGRRNRKLDDEDRNAGRKEEDVKRHTHIHGVSWLREDTTITKRKSLDAACAGVIAAACCSFLHMRLKRRRCLLVQDLDLVQRLLCSFLSQMLSAFSRLMLCLFPDQRSESTDT